MSKFVDENGVSIKFCSVVNQFLKEKWRILAMIYGLPDSLIGARVNNGETIRTDVSTRAFKLQNRSRLCCVSLIYLLAGDATQAVIALMWLRSTFFSRGARDN